MFVRRLTVLATVLTLISACDEVATAPQRVDAGSSLAPLFHRGQGGHMVPFKSDFVYSLSAAGNDPVPCGGNFPQLNAVAVDITGTGKASHMGKTVLEFTVASCSVDVDVVAFEAWFTAVGTATLTGANGDAVFVNTTAVFDLIPFLTGASDFGALEIGGPITGGTGRFERATGSLGGTGVANFPETAGTFSLDGTVSSVGSSGRG